MNDDKHDIIDAEIIEDTVIEKEDPDMVQLAKYLVGVVAYCIIGLAIDYWLFVAIEATTAWANPLTYAVMVFWPAILFWKFLVFAFWVLVVIAVICVCVMVIARFNRGF